jgi:uncharacterized membrane protein YgaE (UPF0421/DUF939 family)
MSSQIIKDLRNVKIGDLNTIRKILSASPIPVNDVKKEEATINREEKSFFDAMNNEKLETEKLCNQEKRLENEAKKIDNENKVKNALNREKYAKKAFNFLYISAIFVVLMLLLNFFCNSHRFENSVLIAIVSSLSVNVIGVVLVVLNYYFPKDK